ncbi:MAG: hypothetical protein L0216_18995, partial [Planctomycetales bacterium]|nr:hypothetical protein [Planctomycetales bacterium]
MTHRLIRIALAGAAVLVALGASAGSASAATNYSVTSGPWETASTWSSGRPGSNDDVIIMPGHLVEVGDTSQVKTYTIRSLEVRAGGRIQHWNPTTTSGTGTWQVYIRCTNIGPTGYSILNRGLIHNQLTMSMVVEANGPVRTDGSSIASRTSQPMGGFSWGWNNVAHAGGTFSGGGTFTHNHSGGYGNYTPGICLILNGGTVANPHGVSQQAAININGPSFAPSLDALPRTYVQGAYRLASDADIYAFESRIEDGGQLELNGYRLMSQGPIHVGDDAGTGSSSVLRINDGTGTSNIGTWPQFRIVGGAALQWKAGALVEIPTGSRGSAVIGAAVNMLQSARLNIYGEPTIPAALQNGGAPTFWIVGNLLLADTSRVDIVVPGSPNNPTNAVLQVGQDLSFKDNLFPPTGSAAWITQTGNHGASGFPVVLVQSAAGGGNTTLPRSEWRGLVGGTTPGSTTAGWTLTNSTLVHQGGVDAYDDFKFLASGGNPGSLWGVHSIHIGLASYQQGATTINILNATDLSLGGLGTSFILDGSALAVKGNRAVTNGGGGNLFVSGGATFSQRKRAPNLPAGGSIGVVDVNGNLQVTGAGVYNLATLATAGEESTLRVLGQGTLPPGRSGLSVPASLRRQAPLGNLSLDDGGSLGSNNSGNVLVFIGEKWHSSSATVKIHPSQVIGLLNSRTVTFTATGGVVPYTYSLLSGAGSLSATTYTAPATGSGTAVVRVRDSANPQQFVDAIIRYQGLGSGPLSLSPGFAGTSPAGICYYLRSDLGNTVALRAFGGSGTYSWNRSGGGSLSGTSGQTVTFTAGNGTSPAVVTLADGTGSTRTCSLYMTTSTFYGYTYPTPYYMYHLRIGDTQTLARPANSGTWTFLSNGSNATLNGGSSATGASVTLNAGTVGGLTSFSIWNYGNVTSATATGYFYFYTTALPSNLTISPSQFDGWLPGASYTFGGGGGNTPYTFSLLVNGGGSTITTGGNYSAGATSTSSDTVQLQDQSGVAVTCVVNKSAGTPVNGNAYIAVPGAKTIFTNSTTNSVSTILFADGNDDFGTFQVLKTLSSGNRVLPSSIEISPAVLTMVTGRTQTFTGLAGTTPYTYSLFTNNSGGSIGSSSGVYTAGPTVNTVDTVQVTDASGQRAVATVNVIAGAVLEVRPRYVYYFHPGQQLQMRTIGASGSVTWSFQTNGSGGTISSGGLYTAGTPSSTAWDRIQATDSAGNYDYAYFGVYNWSFSTFYTFPLWAYINTDTGAGKTRNGFDPGQTIQITTVNGTSVTWNYSANNSGGTLNGSGASATWTAGNTGNVTDFIQAIDSPTVQTCWYKVQSAPLIVSPTVATVFGGQGLRFSASGGTGNYTYSLLVNGTGASVTQTGSPAVGLYTAGLTLGSDTVQISDGAATTNVVVTVLSQSNPTSIFCSHVDLWHGTLDVNGRPFRVRRQGATPAGQGEFVAQNGGIAGATNPTLAMAAGTLTVDRTFIWDRFCTETITGGTLTVGGSVKITDDAGGASPKFDLQAPFGGTSTLVLTAANPDTATANTVDIWRATSSGGTPTAQNLYVVNLTVNDGGAGRTFNFLGPVCYSGTYTLTSGTIAGITPQPNATCGSPSGMPPGFVLYTTPATFTNTTVNNGMWINSTSASCFVFTGTVTVNGGIVVENGCIDVQGTLVVNGDVYMGMGLLTQDRTNNPTII